MLIVRIVRGHVQCPDSRQLSIQPYKYAVSDSSEEDTAAAIQKVVVSGRHTRCPTHLVMKQGVDAPGEARIGWQTAASEAQIVDETRLGPSTYLKKKALSHLALICDLEYIVPNAHLQPPKP